MTRQRIASDLRVVDLLARHEPRADRAEGVGRLAARPLAVGELQVARADVVDADVAADVVERVALGDAAAGAADDDAELGLVVDLGALGRQDDRLARADERVRPLGEQQRRRRQVGALLLRVVAVVQPDADDLRRTIDRERHGRNLPAPASSPQGAWMASMTTRLPRPLLRGCRGGVVAAHPLAVTAGDDVLRRRRQRRRRRRRGRRGAGGRGAGPVRAGRRRAAARAPARRRGGRLRRRGRGAAAPDPPGHGLRPGERRRPRRRRRVVRGARRVRAACRSPTCSGRRPTWR